MSDTPRTDAMLASLGLRCGCSEKPIELCYTLERELAAVTSERDQLLQKMQQVEAEMDRLAGDKQRLIDTSMDGLLELGAVAAERDRLRETHDYCMGILRKAGHDEAAPLEAMVRRSIAYGERMEKERGRLRAALELWLLWTTKNGMPWPLDETKAALGKENA